MIHDRLKKLLTSYVDGELSVRQRKAVQKLLHRSVDARQLLEQLQEDSREIHALPRRRLERDLTRSVMQTIALEGVHPARKRVLAQSALPAWAGLAAAAAVLLVIGFASYVYFTVADAHLNQPAIVQQLPAPAVDADRGLAKGGNPDENPEVVGLPKPRPENPEQPAPHVAQNGNPTSEKPMNPDGDPNQNGNILASPRNPNGPKFDFEMPQSRLTNHVVRDLDQDSPRQQLLVELKKDPAYRLELFCLDTIKAFERMQAAFKTQNIKLQIDAEAQLRLKYKQPVSFAFLLEDVTPDELVKLLQSLGEDRKQFGNLLVSPLAASDLDELAKMLGVQPAQVPPRKKNPQGVDIRRPLPETTAAQVAQALSPGASTRPSEGSKSAGTKTPERPALALAYKVAASREARLFLDTRKEPRPGALQILLVLQVPRG